MDNVTKFLKTSYGNGYGYGYGGYGYGYGKYNAHRKSKAAEEEP